mgnify:CR=1 FL=1
MFDLPDDDLAAIALIYNTFEGVNPEAERVRVEAEGARDVTIWGTGSPLRDFMHVDDLADALVFLMERYDQAGPINVGTGSANKGFSLRGAVEIGRASCRERV